MSAGRFSSTSIQIAARDGDLSRVRDLIRDGADVNADTGNLNSPLFEATTNCHIEVLELLLKADANVEFRRGERKALDEAIRKRHEHIAEMLVRAGASVKGAATYADLPSPLDAAARAGFQGLVTLLLERGADVKYHRGPTGTALN